MTLVLAPGFTSRTSTMKGVVTSRHSAAMAPGASQPRHSAVSLDSAAAAVSSSFHCVAHEVGVSAGQTFLAPCFYRDHAILRVRELIERNVAMFACLAPLIGGRSLTHSSLVTRRPRRVFELSCTLRRHQPFA